MLTSACLVSHNGWKLDINGRQNINQKRYRLILLKLQKLSVNFNVCKINVLQINDRTDTISGHSGGTV